MPSKTPSEKKQNRTATSVIMVRLTAEQKETIQRGAEAASVGLPGGAKIFTGPWLLHLGLAASRGLGVTGATPGNNSKKPTAR